MGGGSWDVSTYDRTVGATLASGKSGFEYSDTTRTRNMNEWKAHETLDPTSVNKKGDHAGQNVRESMDSEDHPNSLAVGVVFDVTGSMGQVPITLQKKLPALLGLLGMKGYVDDPQILFGAVGDATSDRVPLQMGQFESDNRLDENLGNIFVERGGGGGSTESYELALYFFARHTYTDCFEKRQHKGYLFLIGDEHPYPQVKAREVRRVLGEEIPENISIKDIVAEVQNKWELYVLIPATASGQNPNVIKTWRNLVGQNLILLDDLGESAAEVIAVTVGLAEEAIELSQGLDDLRAAETDDVTLKAVEKALTRA